MTPRLDPNPFLPTMGEFFTFGITLPEPQETVMVLSKHKEKTDADETLGMRQEYCPGKLVITVSNCQGYFKYIK